DGLQAGAVLGRGRVRVRQTEPGLEQREPEQVAQPFRREVARVEGGQHPVVEEIEARIEEEVIGIEGGAAQPSRFFELALPGGCRRRAASGRTAPPTSRRPRSARGTRCCCGRTRTWTRDRAA